MFALHYIWIEHAPDVLVTENDESVYVPPLTITTDEVLLRTLVESLQESSKLIMALI